MWAIVGPYGGVVPGFLPQTSQYPVVAYRLLSSETPTTLNPAERAHSVAVQSRYRFFSCTKGIGNYLQAKRLDEAVRLCLHGFAGTVISNDSPSDTLGIAGIFSENAFDSFDPETQTHQVIRDFAVWAAEPRPEPLGE